MLIITRRVDTDIEDQVTARLPCAECREQAFKRIREELVVDIVEAPTVLVSVLTLAAIVLLQFHAKPYIANLASLSEQNSSRVEVGEARYRQADLGKVKRLDDRLPGSGNGRKQAASPTESRQETNDLVSNLGR